MKLFLKCVSYFSLLQEVLHTISAPSGQVQRIVIFKKNGVQAMVEYPFAIPSALVHSAWNLVLKHASFTKLRSREDLSLTWHTCFLFLPPSLFLLLFLRETTTRRRSLSVTRHRYNAMKIYKRNQRVTRLQDLPVETSFTLSLALIPWPEYRRELYRIYASYTSWHTGSAYLLKLLCF